MLALCATDCFGSEYSFDPGQALLLDFVQVTAYLCFPVGKHEANASDKPKKDTPSQKAKPK
jgi:hypothetical protein